MHAEGEFVQPLGRLVIRGSEPRAPFRAPGRPTASILACAANLPGPQSLFLAALRPCNVTVSGFNLAADDLLQVAPLGLEGWPRSVR